MKLIRGTYNLDKIYRKCALTIGNFDGVHRGHQALLQELKKESKIRSLPVIVMIFEPHPLEYFSGEKAPARLTCLREKLYYLAQCGVDSVLCIRFDQRFAALTANNFINDFLIKCLDIQFLIVGKDFRFGADRRGDFFLLQQSGKKYNFDVVSTKTFFEEGVRISSTAVRQALAKNELEVAENLLGHPFSISGRVIHGNKVGRTIGFPTINLLLHRIVSPVKGVYAVEVIGIGKIPLFGIANIGIRPTVNGVRRQLEVHLLDVIIDLYGCYISVILRKKIRNERKFASLNELKKQIVHDTLTARSFFGIVK